MSNARVLLASAFALGNGVLLTAVLMLPIEKAAAEPSVAASDRAAAAAPVDAEAVKKPEAKESLPKRVAKKARKMLAVRDFGGY